MSTDPFLAPRRGWREVAKAYVDRHPGETMSVDYARKIHDEAIRKMRTLLARDVLDKVGRDEERSME